MAYIHTCKYCSKQYTVYYDGEYICECGAVFQYPVNPKKERHHHSLSTYYMDSPSRSIKRRTKTHYSHKLMLVEECPLAKGAFIMALLSVFSFALLAPPALILAFAARTMISDKRYHYTGDNIAIAAIIISLISLICWGMWFLA